jgi:hypothetical protein
MQFNTYTWGEGRRRTLPESTAARGAAWAQGEARHRQRRQAKAGARREGELVPAGERLRGGGAAGPCIDIRLISARYSADSGS